MQKFIAIQSLYEYQCFDLKKLSLVSFFEFLNSVKFEALI
jgi:hypothetical protein